MSNTLSKILSIFLGLLLIVSVVAVVWFYFDVSGLPAEATIAEQMDLLGAPLEFFMKWAYVLLGITAIVALIFPIINMVLNPKKALKSIISVAALALLIFVAYSFSSDELIKFHNWEIFYSDFFPDEATLDNVKVKAQDLSWKVGTGLITMYVLAGLAVLSLLVSGIVNAFK